MSLNLDQNLAISRLCKEILLTQENIYSVLSLNKNGRAIESQFARDRILSQMNKSEIEMLCMQRTLQTSLGMDYDELVGPLNCITIERETVFEFLFPYSEGVIFVICDLDVIPRYLSKKILFIIREFEWRSKNLIYKQI
ncbi:hypothetical protein [Nitrosopumilus sp.]|uniref:hypothetical protein n=1 Tax=Nitrosopumilus sp. TaxID=2024843 RepID=UPI00349FDBC5